MTASAISKAASPRHAGKGSGEPAHVPTASAIANAVYDAIGVRPTNGPIEPMTILELLAKKKRG